MSAGDSTQQRIAAQVNAFKVAAIQMASGPNVAGNLMSTAATLLASSASGISVGLGPLDVVGPNGLKVRIEKWKLELEVEIERRLEEHKSQYGVVPFLNLHPFKKAEKEKEKEKGEFKSKMDEKMKKASENNFRDYLDDKLREWNEKALQNELRKNRGPDLPPYKLIDPDSVFL